MPHWLPSQGRLAVLGLFSAEYNLGILILRVFIGLLLMTHGYPKLTSGFKGTKKWLASVGLPSLLGPLVGILELLGGAFLALGLLTRIVAFLFTLQFLGIILNGKRLGKTKLNDYEKDLLYLGGALALVLLGGGAYSVLPLVGL